MTDVLSKIPLVGWGPIITIAAIAVSCLIIAVLLWRNHKVWRWVFVFLFLVFGVGTAADYVNTQFAYYDNAADLLGIPTYPTVRRQRQWRPTSSNSPTAPSPRSPCPTPRASSAAFEAQVWLPPQYFSDPRAALPGRLSSCTGTPARRPTGSTCGRRRSHRPQRGAGRSPGHPRHARGLQNNLTGDSLCVDTAAQGNAETYITKDVIAAIDTQLRTTTNAKGRAIGGLSMGGFCGLNLGPQAPRPVLGGPRPLRRDRVRAATPCPAGTRRSTAARTGSSKADANSPTKYVSTLDGSKGPAIWMDVGTSDAAIIAADADARCPSCRSKGFTVEFRHPPGAHDYTYWTAGLKDALPWAAQKLQPAPHLSTPGIAHHRRAPLTDA